VFCILSEFKRWMLIITLHVEASDVTHGEILGILKMQPKDARLNNQCCEHLKLKVNLKCTCNSQYRKPVLKILTN